MKPQTTMHTVHLRINSSSFGRHDSGCLSCIPQDRNHFPLYRESLRFVKPSSGVSFPLGGLKGTDLGGQ